MYLRDLWTSCVRRWYLVVAFVLISAALLTAASLAVKPTYESTASLVLVPPPSPDSPTLNRYLDLGGLSDAVAVLANSMSSDALQQEFAAEVNGGQYEVGADITTSAPILVVTAKAGDKADCARLLNLILDRVPANLGALQSSLKITTSSQITAVNVSEDPPKKVEKTRLRLLGALGVVLLFVSALTIALLDGLLVRRRSAKTGRATVHSLERDSNDSGDSGDLSNAGDAGDSDRPERRTHAVASTAASAPRRTAVKRRRQIRSGRESRSNLK